MTLKTSIAHRDDLSFFLLAPHFLSVTGGLAKPLPSVPFLQPRRMRNVLVPKHLRVLGVRLCVRNRVANG